VQKTEIGTNVDCQTLSTRRSSRPVVVEHATSRTAATPYARFRFSSGKPT